MNLLIVHYHLNRGGVSRVIENHLLALDSVLEESSPWNVVIAFGGRHDGWPDDLPERLGAIKLRLVSLPSLDYDEERGEGDPGEELLGLLGNLGFRSEETVVHIHNHSLGKNSAMPECVGKLAEAGYPLLLQVHDFAEDYRPTNYRRIADPTVLYPQGPQIHYATLNGRDFRMLEAAGVDPERLNLLPNPVPGMGELPPREEARAKLAERFGIGSEKTFVLYPVRCIRRKNVGEMILLAALAPPNVVFAPSLAPINPTETPIYEGWKSAVEALGLPVVFEVGEPGGLSFAENLSAADAIITTSLAEGFGMVFLESWLAERPLIGRDLPEITADFAAAGVKFDWLYERIDVPVEWVGGEAFHIAMEDFYRQTLAAYKRRMPKDAGARLTGKIREGLVDFGDLHEILQETIVTLVCEAEKNRQTVLDANPWIQSILSIRREDASETIESNRRKIEETYSLRPSGKRMHELYAKVSASAGKHELLQLSTPEKILDSFLSPERFRLIRSV